MESNSQPATLDSTAGCIPQVNEDKQMLIKKWMARQTFLKMKHLGNLCVLMLHVIPKTDISNMVWLLLGHKEFGWIS